MTSQGNLIRESIKEGPRTWAWLNTGVVQWNSSLRIHIFRDFQEELKTTFFTSTGPWNLICSIIKTIKGIWVKAQTWINMYKCSTQKPLLMKLFVVKSRAETRATVGKANYANERGIAWRELLNKAPRPPLPLGGDKVSMLTHTYPHKPPRKITVTICNHQADSPLHVWPDVWSGDL